MMSSIVVAVFFGLLGWLVAMLALIRPWQSIRWRFPWSVTRKRLDAIVDQVLRIRDIVETVMSLLTRPASLPPPSAHVLVFGDSDHGPMTLGATQFMHKRHEQLRLHTYVNLRNIRVIVLSDLDRVRASQILIGNSVLTAGGMLAVMAECSCWNVAIRLQVDLERVD